MKFKKIVSIDNTGLIEPVQEKLNQLADEVVLHEDFPTSNLEIIERIGDADCVLVSWNTRIEREVIESCPTIKYIGMCCSLYDEKSANVDIEAAREQGITVLGVRDYGDEGVAEFIISELIRLLQGFGEQQWQEDLMELTEQKLGIIGLGATGIMVADRAMAFGMDVYYYSRTRKPEQEERGIKYLELDELLKEVDIISTHLPRNTIALDSEAFKKFGSKKILINTSLGPTFDMGGFEAWIAEKSNYGIFDRAGMGIAYDKLKEHSNVIYSDKVAGWTKQAKARLSVKALNNIETYLKQE